jgi:mannose-6-phosphate isomerase class I
MKQKFLKPLKNNFVERPWGGTSIREFKRLVPLPDQHVITGMGLGEAFEISAFDADTEARLYPSRVLDADGTLRSVSEILAERGDELLGRAFTRQFGACMPVLPKTLNVRELLSVQGHPEGNTEVYIIIDAEPGATLRLGFREDLDSARFKAELTEGRCQQELVQSLLGDEMSSAEFQVRVAPWLARRGSGAEDIDILLAGGLTHQPQIVETMMLLKALYWRVLDAMNEIPLSVGQVIYNANPARIVATSGRAPSAEAHALGNPQGKEFLALEIRRPGPTFRAWDNVRFPMREVDVEAAVDALNLQATSVDEFLVTPQPLAGRSGVFCSIDSSAFRVEHLRPGPESSVAVPAGPPHCLHVISGTARFVSSDGSLIDILDRGESALVPVTAGAYHVECVGQQTEIIKVNLPIGTR